MALTDKSIESTYKDILQIENSNSGLESTGNMVKDGDGNSSNLLLGTVRTAILPTVNSSANFSVKNAGGDFVFKVDGTNKQVKVNETQLTANTQYLRFSANDINVDNGTHIGVPVAGQVANTAVTFGTAGDPVAPTVANNGDDWVHYLHYVDTNITVDAVNILVGGQAATGDSLNFHLCNIATSDTTVVNSWSGTTIVADTPVFLSNQGYEQFNRLTLNMQSTDVDAGNYLALTIEGNGTNSDYSINAIVRYHLR
tara:strand:+ start:4049 stop:4813 length:765 start_codon:yes stop_codon:yes gene_type:complete